MEDEGQSESTDLTRTEGKTLPRKRGRPRIEVSKLKLEMDGRILGTGYDLLYKLATYGLTLEQIANIFAFSARTLRTRLREDERAWDAVSAGRAHQGMAIMKRLQGIALGADHNLSESRKACEFLLERRFGFVRPSAAPTHAQQPAEFQIILTQVEGDEGAELPGGRGIGLLSSASDDGTEGGDNQARKACTDRVAE